ncbi:hypothetical protein JNUCC0626_08130 [Lentzea sp. JNUCC 0626]|uniref:hypothetical protein n=1 Tax=Lentzea sp. JNUCC 0626 TaxID=3367513 RepID=UPI00374948B1
MNEISELRTLVARLRENVRRLALRSGHDHGVRRLVNDVERVAIDVDELNNLFAAVPQQREEVVLVSDAPYEPAFWHGADDEGVGGHRRHPR